MMDKFPEEIKMVIFCLLYLFFLSVFSGNGSLGRGGALNGIEVMEWLFGMTFPILSQVCSCLIYLLAKILFNIYAGS